MGIGNCCECNPNLDIAHLGGNNMFVEYHISGNLNYIEDFCKLDFLQAYNESPWSSLIYWNNNINSQLK